MTNKIWIANDHGGYELKKLVINYLQEHGYEFEDKGSDSSEIVRYPYYAAKVAYAVSTKQIARGILICSTGIGMSIIANKYKNVRAALCTNTCSAKLTRQHNNSNILCLGGKITGEFEAIEIVDTWLNAEYIGGRHDISLGLIEEASDVLCNDMEWIPRNMNL